MDSQQEQHSSGVWLLVRIVTFLRWLGEQPARVFKPFYRATISAPATSMNASTATVGAIDFTNTTNGSVPIFFPAHAPKGQAYAVAVRQMPPQIPPTAVTEKQSPANSPIIATFAVALIFIGALSYVFGRRAGRRDAQVQIPATESNREAPATQGTAPEAHAPKTTVSEHGATEASAPETTDQQPEDNSHLAALESAVSRIEVLEPLLRSKDEALNTLTAEKATLMNDLDDMAADLADAQKYLQRSNARVRQLSGFDAKTSPAQVALIRKLESARGTIKELKAENDDLVKKNEKLARVVHDSKKAKKLASPLENLGDVTMDLLATLFEKTLVPGSSQPQKSRTSTGRASMLNKIDMSMLESRRVVTAADDSRASLHGRTEQPLPSLMENDAHQDRSAAESSSQEMLFPQPAPEHSPEAEDILQVRDSKEGTDPTESAGKLSAATEPPAGKHAVQTGSNTQLEDSEKNRKSPESNKKSPTKQEAPADEQPLEDKEDVKFSDLDDDAESSKKRSPVPSGPPAKDEDEPKFSDNKQPPSSLMRHTPEKPATQKTQTEDEVEVPRKYEGPQRRTARLRTRKQAPVQQPVFSQDSIDRAMIQAAKEAPVAAPPTQTDIDFGAKLSQAMPQNQNGLQSPMKLTDHRGKVVKRAGTAQKRNEQQQKKNYARGGPLSKHLTSSRGCLANNTEASAKQKYAGDATATLRYGSPSTSTGSHAAMDVDMEEATPAAGPNIGFVFHQRGFANGDQTEDVSAVAAKHNPTGEKSHAAMDFDMEEATPATGLNNDFVFQQRNFAIDDKTEEGPAVSAKHDPTGENSHATIDLEMEEATPVTGLNNDFVFQQRNLANTDQTEEVSAVAAKQDPIKEKLVFGSQHGTPNATGIQQASSPGAKDDLKPMTSGTELSPESQAILDEFNEELRHSEQAGDVSMMEDSTQEHGPTENEAPDGQKDVGDASRSQPTGPQDAEDGPKTATNNDEHGSEPEEAQDDDGGAKPQRSNGPGSGEEKSQNDDGGDAKPQRNIMPLRRRRRGPVAKPLQEILRDGKGKDGKIEQSESGNGKADEMETGSEQETEPQSQAFNGSTPDWTNRDFVREIGLRAGQRDDSESESEAE